MDRPETVAELTQILRGGGYLADRGLSTSLFVALSLDRPILIAIAARVGKTRLIDNTVLQGPAPAPE